MVKTLRVGLIGASVDRGWARDSHVPAIQALAGLELAAVATNSQETADAAARAFGAVSAYGDALQLVRDPAVDLVAVAVKVPGHRDLVLAALAAGKHVYCEWPLGRDAEESQEMAAVAAMAGVHTAIGLQTRLNPAARQASRMIAEGAIGRVLSARVLSTTVAFGPTVEQPDAYTEVPENGVTLVTIQGAHTIDLATALLGKLRSFDALLNTQYPDVEVGKLAERRTRSTFDHLLLQGRLERGGALSIEVAGGRPVETPFRMEVIGSGGVLALAGGAARGFQAGRLRLSLDGQEQAVADAETTALPDAAANVAEVYAALRDDIGAGTWVVPGFDHAVQLARLMARVADAARTGIRANQEG